MRVLAGLDSHSNVTFVAEDIARHRPWAPGEERLVLGLGKHAVETKPVVTTLLRKGRPILLEGRLEPGGQFQDKEMKLLLSAQAIKELGIDVHAALDTNEHKDVVWRRRQPTHAKYSRRGGRRSKQSRTAATWHYRKITRIAEVMMQQYLARTGGSARQPKQVSVDDVVMGDSLTVEDKQLVKAVVSRYTDVFMNNPDDIPPALDIDPVEWQLKPGVKPVRCKRPNWGPAQKAFLIDWTRKALKQGLIVPADKTGWASRPVLVPKYRGDTAKGDVPDDIRVCVDYIAVNELIRKLVDQ